MAVEHEAANQRLGRHRLQDGLEPGIAPLHAVGFFQKFSEGTPIGVELRLPQQRRLAGAGMTETVVVRPRSGEGLHIADHEFGLDPETRGFGQGKTQLRHESLARFALRIERRPAQPVGIFGGGAQITGAVVPGAGAVEIGVVMAAETGLPRPHLRAVVPRPLVREAADHPHTRQPHGGIVHQLDRQRQHDLRLHLGIGGGLAGDRVSRVAAEFPGGPVVVAFPHELAAEGVFVPHLHIESRVLRVAGVEDIPHRASHMLHIAAPAVHRFARFGIRRAVLQHVAGKRRIFKLGQLRLARRNRPVQRSGELREHRAVRLRNQSGDQRERHPLLLIVQAGAPGAERCKTALQPQFARSRRGGGGQFDRHGPARTRPAGVRIQQDHRAQLVLLRQRQHQLQPLDLARRKLRFVVEVEMPPADLQPEAAESRLGEQPHRRLALRCGEVAPVHRLNPAETRRRVRVHVGPPRRQVIGGAAERYLLLEAVLIGAFQLRLQRPAVPLPDAGRCFRAGGHLRQRRFSAFRRVADRDLAHPDRRRSVAPADRPAGADAELPERQCPRSRAPHRFSALPRDFGGSGSRIVIDLK